MESKTENPGVTGRLTLEDVRAWANEVELSFGGSPGHDANANMLSFGIPSGAPAAWFSWVVATVLGVYAEKVTLAGERGLFYAWLDEQIPALRCSFFKTTGAPPFSAPTRKWTSLEDFSGRLEHVNSEVEAAFHLGLAEVDVESAFDDSGELVEEPVEPNWAVDVFQVKIPAEP